MIQAKFLLHLCLCVYVGNCQDYSYKCDYKEIINLRNGNVVDRDTFCKERICVLRICTHPDDMQIRLKSGLKCEALSKVRESTNTSTDVPVYKVVNSSWALSGKRINFDFVKFKNLKDMVSKDECFFTPNPGNMFLLEDGSLRVPDYNMTIQPLGFVVDFRMTKKENGEWNEPILVAKILHESKSLSAKEIFDITGMLTSSVFLILVLVVYSSFKTLRQAPYIKMLMTYIACLAVSYALAASQRLALYFEPDGGIFCKCISSIMYYSLMATYFWLNVIAFEIWNAFRPKNEYRPRQSRDGQHTFLKACLYAFGMPLVMLITVVIIDEMDFPIDKPQFEMCMQPYKSKLYHYIPIATILCVNLVFFLMTTYYFYKQKIGKSLNNSESRTNTPYRNNFSLYLKLTVSTGLDWFLDVIDMFMQLPYYITYAIEAYSLSLGVTMFFILCVFNRNVNDLVSKRFNINNRFMIFSSTKSTNISHSSSQRRESMKSKSSMNNKTNH